MKKDEIMNFGVHGKGTKGFKAYAQSLCNEECEVMHYGWSCEARSTFDGRLVATWNTKNNKVVTHHSIRG